ncbi:MAG: response regulator [Lachnospiraceae bacterium]|nr:response regulator [Lachnospiraceae bacterium]
MRDQSYYIGRLISIVLYMAQGLFTTIKMFTDRNVPNPAAATILIFWLVTCVIIIRLTEEHGMSSYVFCVFTCISSTVMAVVMAYLYRSIVLVMIVYMVQCLAVICFKQRRSCLVIGFTTAFALVQFAVLDIMGIYCFINWLEFWCCLIAVLVSMWVAFHQIEILQIQEKKNEINQKGLDDMLHVVEVMCDEARDATKSKSQFLSNMSHEIRTPINSMLGMNEMILRECTDEQTIKYARNIESSGKMLLSLINDILDFSKIESGKMEVIYSDYRLSTMLNDLTNIIATRMQEKKLDFSVEVDPMTPECLMGDEIKIKQIVTNFLTNAVKYTDEGSVKLKVYPENRRKDANTAICFEVIDTGRGIKMQDQEVLFHAFERVDQKKNRSIEGTGLGLAIASNFTALMDGEIGVESEYGKGSDFYVKIPQIVTSGVQIGEYSFNQKAPKGERRKHMPCFIAPDVKLLIVDDNEMNLTVASFLLKENQMQITTATGGWQSVELLRQQHFDAVLLDHMMPELDGVDALKIMKAEGLVVNTPVIALTANAVSGAREKYLEAGFSDYLSKPIVGRDLEKLLMRWLPQDKLQIVATEEDAGA